MRRWTIAYSVIAAWMFGWLAGRFGLLPSFFVAIVLLVPAVSAWRMAAYNRTIMRREYAYLGLVTVLAVVATVLIAVKWHDAGMDRRAMFDREYRAFRNRINSMPEYSDVRVSYHRGKGGRVALHGRVANRDDHSRLLQMAERMIRNNALGHYDGVKYPGKPNETEAESSVSNGIGE